ncbi:hypothetical protein P7K49_014881, partial [Saguinus oedipus]
SLEVCGVGSHLGGGNCPTADSGDVFRSGDREKKPSNAITTTITAKLHKNTDTLHPTPTELTKTTAYRGTNRLKTKNENNVTTLKQSQRKQT